jgi:hypothetical protein
MIKRLFILVLTLATTVAAVPQQETPSRTRVKKVEAVKKSKKAKKPATVEIGFPPATERGQILEPGTTPPATTLQESEKRLR